jgi:putative FmdB family regulatory protein
MPLYTYHCESCEADFDDSAKIAEYQEPRPCPECGLSSPRTMGDRFPGFVLKGDGWPGKNNRIKGQMERKNKHLAGKEREQKGDGMVPSLVPNVDGERTDSWSEATKLAQSKGKDTSGYKKYARKERSGAA